MISDPIDFLLMMLWLVVFPICGSAAIAIPKIAKAMNILMIRVILLAANGKSSIFYASFVRFFVLKNYLFECIN